MTSRPRHSAAFGPRKQATSAVRESGWGNRFVDTRNGCALRTRAGGMPGARDIL